MNRLTLLMAIALCGCSLLNAPDESLIYEDGGVDTSVEDARDAGLDGGDGDGDVVDAGPDPEICDNGMDDDGDTLVDCADLDCAGSTDCCRPGSTDNVTFLETPAEWLTEGIASVSDGAVRFSFEDQPDAITSRACFPLAQGAFFEPVFRFVANDPSCDEDTLVCDYFAAFFVSNVGVRPMLGGRIGSEFSITAYASGLFEFRLGDRVIGSHRVNAPAGPLRTKVTFSPGTDSEGDSRLFVAVEVGGTLINLGAQLIVEDLTSGCSSTGIRGEGVPGLLFGVEGTGTAIEITSTVLAGTSECTNPSLFRRDRNELPLAASDVGGSEVHSMGWATDDEGGIKWPELVRRDGDWQILGSFTNEQPLLEPLTPNFPWQIASATNTDFDSPVDVSEPMYIEDASQPTALYSNGSLFLVVRREGELRFGADVSTEVPDPTAVWVEPSAECDEVSHPALALQPAWEAVGPQLVLFYVCRLGTTITVRRQRHQNDPTVALIDDIPVLNVNAFAGVDEIKDLAVMIDQREQMDGPRDEMLVRLWLVGQGLLGESLLLATGQYKPSEPAPGALSLLPYAGNPVGTAATLLERRAGETATLEGIAVERDSATRLRFLLSRRLQFAGGGRRWDFVPLTQVWGAL